MFPDTESHDRLARRIWLRHQAENAFAASERQAAAEALAQMDEEDRDRWRVQAQKEIEAAERQESGRMKRLVWGLWRAVLTVYLAIVTAGALTAGFDVLSSTSEVAVPVGAAIVVIAPVIALCVAYAIWRREVRWLLDRLADID